MARFSAAWHQGTYARCPTNLMIDLHEMIKMLMVMVSGREGRSINVDDHVSHDF